MATATIGITRALDDLGRIVIPIEYRKQLGIAAGDDVEITRTGNAIRMRKPGHACEACEGTGIA